MNKDEIIKALRDMAKYPTVTLPRDCEALRAAANFLAQPHETTLKEFNQLIHDDPKYHIWAKEKEALADPMREVQRLGQEIEQEPMAWRNAEKRTFEWNGPVLWNTPTVAVLNKIPLYTHPPQRKVHP